MPIEFGTPTLREQETINKGDDHFRAGILFHGVQCEQDIFETLSEQQIPTRSIFHMAYDALSANRDNVRFQDTEHYFMKITDRYLENKTNQTQKLNFERGQQYAAQRYPLEGRQLS